MTDIVLSLAGELFAAYAKGETLPLPSTREGGLDMVTAYAVEAELVRLRAAAGHKPVGRKVGYANKAAWRILKLDTLVWAHMYDDTVRFAAGNAAALSLIGTVAPKIEPEIVFKLKKPLGGSTDPAVILDAVEWIALGFEIIDCVFPNWEFQPADFVAAFGLHIGLIVGEPKPVTAESIPMLVEQLAKFKLRLMKNGELAEEGAGKNSLRSPALCLGELARITSLEPGELVSSGTLTTPQWIASGDTWVAELDGLELPPLTLRL